MAISKTAAAIGSIAGGLGITVTGGAIYITSTGKTETISDSPTTNLEDGVEQNSVVEPRSFQLNTVPSTEETLETIKEKITKWAKDNGDCKIKIRLSKEEKFKEINQFNDNSKTTNLEKLYTVLSSSKGENDDAKSKCTAAGKNRKMEIIQEDSGSKWDFQIETLATIKEKITKWAGNNCTVKVKPSKWKENAKELNGFTQESDKDHLIGLNVYLTGSGATSAKEKCKDSVTLEAKKNGNTWTLTKVEG